MADVKIIDHTSQVMNDTDLAIQIALEIIGGKMERYAKTRCPVDTGLLRNSIVYAVSGGMPSASSYHATYGSATYKDKDGKLKRRSATAKKAGTVKFGSYGGPIGSSEEKAVYVGTNVKYAPFVELGASKRKPKPFIIPAVTDHISEYQKIIAEELKKALG